MALPEDTLVNGRRNQNSHNLTEPEGEVCSPSPQVDINFDTIPSSGIYFSDVAKSPNLESIIDLSTKQSIRPLLIINTLCFIIGFAEGNLWDLTCKFKVLSGMSQLEIRVTYALYYW